MTRLSPGGGGLSPGSALSALSPHCRDPGLCGQGSSTSRALPADLYPEYTWSKSHFGFLQALRLWICSGCCEHPFAFSGGVLL